MKPFRQQIEDEVIRRIGDKLLRSKSPSGYLLKCDRYNGEISQAEGVDDMIRIMRGNTPAVLVYTSESGNSKISATRGRWWKNISLELILVSNHMRTRENRLAMDVVAEQEETADPGIYRIEEDIEEILNGQKILACTDYIDPIRSEPLIQEDRFTAWRMIFTIRVQQQAAKRDEGQGKLDSYKINGNLDPIGQDVPPNPLVEAEDILE